MRWHTRTAIRPLTRQINPQFPPCLARVNEAKFQEAFERFIDGGAAESGSFEAHEDFGCVAGATGADDFDELGQRR